MRNYLVLFLSAGTGIEYWSVTAIECDDVKFQEWNLRRVPKSELNGLAVESNLRYIVFKDR